MNLGSAEIVKGYCVHCGGEMTYVDGKLTCNGDIDCLCEMEADEKLINIWEVEDDNKVRFREIGRYYLPC